MAVKHIPHAHIAERESHAHVTRAEHRGFNGKLAVIITNAVSTMWCAYAFAGLALISLPVAMQGGKATIISWTAQTFLQLVLLSVIMVGQKVSAKASDKRSIQMYKDTKALLEITDHIHELLESNIELTEDIHAAVVIKIKPKTRKKI